MTIYSSVSNKYLLFYNTKINIMRGVFLIVLCLFISENLLSQKIIKSCDKCSSSGKITKLNIYTCNHCSRWTDLQKKYNVCSVCNNRAGEQSFETITCDKCKGAGEYRDYAQEKRNKEFGGKDYKMISSPEYIQIEHLKILQNNLVVSKRELDGQRENCGGYN